MSDENSGIGDGERGLENAINPASIVGQPDEPVRRRGRRTSRDTKRPARTASRARTKEADPQVDLSSLTGMFVGIHAMLAAQTHTPELAISPGEGKAFSNAAENVLRHYSIKTTQKTLDWIAFVGVSSAIYVPRIVAIGHRQRQERIERAARAGTTVVDLKPGIRKPNNKDNEPLIIEPEPDPEDGGRYDA